jgi:hypothetical protein
MARSNRQLTQFAVDTLKGYFMTDPVESKVSAGNTELECQICRRCPYAPPQYVVNLFGKQIVRIYTSPLNHRTPIAIMISTGDFYDSKGRPSRTTRERLNGLLDFFCSQEYLPEGVRVFIREDGICCVGKGDAARVFDKSQPAAILMASKTDLVIG